jgi:hypothetical protein
VGVQYEGEPASAAVAGRGLRGRRRGLGLVMRPAAEVAGGETG